MPAELAFRRARAAVLYSRWAGRGTASVVYIRGLRPRGPLPPSLAGPRDPRSAQAGAPVARLARSAACTNEYKVLVSSRITG
jgi:hypothetical protein